MTLIELQTKLNSIKNPTDLFGVDNPHAVYRSLQNIAHPDLNEDKDLAKILCIKINHLWEQYNKPKEVIKGKLDYTIHYQISNGDISDVYFSTDSNSKECIIKIAVVDGGFKLLKNENDILTVLSKEAKDSIYSKTFPQILDSFPIGGTFQSWGNVFSYADKLYTSVEIKNKHTKLDPRHIGWMFKRVLMTLGFIHSRGYIHGAITPEHVLFDTEDHGIKLVGWGHSIKIGNSISTISEKYKSFYPLEVIGKKTSEQSTDIYMAAKLMHYLCNHMPPIMKRFIDSCLFDKQNMRPNDAWKLHDEFTVVLKNLYPTKFIKLEM